jgi:23S rRNA (guanosine2251-2'-O)-methyltransferase
VRKVACGAAESVPFYRVKNLARALEHLRAQGLWIAGLADDGNQELYAADLTGPMVLIMGAEGKGMRRLTREACDYLLRIPMHGAVPSLNVSVATALCLYEARRQRSA